MLVQVENEPVNKQVQMLKSQFDQKQVQMLKSVEETEETTVATSEDKQDTKTKQKYLNPPIKAKQATVYFDNNLMLARSCNIKAEDLILGNDINIKLKDENSTQDIDNIIRSVEASRTEINYMCADYELNGAGCCKITKLLNDDEFRLTQIPQESVRILKINDEKVQDTPLYLVEQEVGSSEKYYKILNEVYPDNFDTYENNSLGMVWWIGGDNFYNFYRKPVWFQTREDLNAQTALKSLDTEKINKGFNMNNIVFFNKKPTLLPYEEFYSESNNGTDNDSENNVTDDYYKYLARMGVNVNAQKIANELKAAGLGTAVLYEETVDPLEMQTAQLSDTNYEYLLEKPKQADQAIISAFGIPRERYMLNDVKESMNSRKTDSFWEIYTKALNGQQNLYETGLRDVIYEVYEDTPELTVDITVPMFSGLINEKIDKYSDLFLKGLLTLGQTVMLLVQYITDLNLDELDLDDPIYQMRFVNGKPINDYSLDPSQQIEYDSIMRTINGVG